MKRIGIDFSELAYAMEESGVTICHFADLKEDELRAWIKAMKIAQKGNPSASMLQKQ